MKVRSCRCKFPVFLIALIAAAFGCLSTSGNAAWIDSATGQPVMTIPLNGGPPLNDAGAQNAHLLSNALGFDGAHAVTNGKNLYWVPCPPPAPPTQTSWSGGFGGVYFVGAFSPVKTVEETAATGAVTHSFNDCCTGFGGGLNAGWQWQLPSDVVLGGVVDAYFPNDEVSHPFAGGTYLRSTVDFAATFQARAGIVATPNLLLYAQTGFALGNQSLKVNFGGPVSRHSDTTPGYTIGAGAEWRLYDGPTGVIGQSPSLFVEYSHIFWDDAHFNTPAASPAFNYTWSRDSNVIKGGLRVRF